MASDIDLFDNIVLNETVYIYKKPQNKFFSKNYINNLFKAVKDEKKEDNVKALFHYEGFLWARVRLRAGIGGCRVCLSGFGAFGYLKPPGGWGQPGVGRGLSSRTRCGNGS